MRFLETFNFRVGNNQERILERYDKTASELSFDIHIKRRQYVEDLVAKSIESEVSGGVDIKGNFRLRQPELPSLKSSALPSTRIIRMEHLGLHKVEQELDHCESYLSTMLKESAELVPNQLDYGMRRKSSIWNGKKKNYLEKDKSRRKTVYYGSIERDEQEYLGETKLGYEPQILSNKVSQQLNSAVDLSIKTKAATPEIQAEPDFLSIANRLQLNISKSATSDSGFVRKHAFKQYESTYDRTTEVGLRSISHAAQSQNTFPGNETALEIKHWLARETMSSNNKLNTEFRTQKLPSKSIHVCKNKEFRLQLESDLDLDSRPNTNELVSLQDSTTALESDVEGQQLGTIHILGMGPIGKYIAHSLSRLEYGPSVTLLMHRPLMIQEWHDEGATIKLLKDDKILVASKFHVESAAGFGKRRDSRQRFAGFGESLEHTVEQPNTVINHLVVTTDPNTTVTALSSIKHRIRETSTICLVQEGLGMVETLNSALFTDPHRRPTYILANMSHDLASTERRFTIREKTLGKIFCSKLPQATYSRAGRDTPIIRRKDFSWSPESKRLVGSLYLAPELNVCTLGHKSFYKAQLERLAVGAVVGPLSVAFDCRNDQLLYNHPASTMMKMLLKEISRIITSLPELQNMSDTQNYFSSQRLEYRVLSSINKTGLNLSSMLRAVRSGEKTNIEFFNGYLIQRALELGIHHPVNEMLMAIVKGKHIIRRREADDNIPFGKF